MKREDYLSWDEYFMGIALLSSLRSKDPSTQVGACIVNSEKRILSMGYNGMPRCCSDDEFPWGKDENPLDSKYLYVCHAELNAILNCASGNVRGCTVYTTLFPCNECAKAIIQSGIAEVVYMSDKYSESDSVLASKRMFTTAGVKFREYNISGKALELKL
ncbi:MAG: dCMP deaminase family protein [Acutalibacteraceae bacterium]|nr:dCMP deaminase family protein [Acutalibacteraceae bacterium]